MPPSKKRKAHAQNPVGIEHFFANQRKRHEAESAIGPAFIQSKPSKEKEDAAVPMDTLNVHDRDSNDKGDKVGNQSNPEQSSSSSSNSDGNAVDRSINSDKSSDQSTTMMGIMQPQAQQYTPNELPLTTDPLRFNPHEYDAIISHWPTESKTSTKRTVPYSFLTHAFATINATSSRISITNILCNMLRVLMIHTPDDVLPTLWLCSNRLGATGVELGVGPLILTRAMTAVSGGISSHKLRQLYRDHGDWGDVAYKIKATIRTIAFSKNPRPLRAREVFHQLRHGLTSVKGKGAVDQKTHIIQRLLLATQTAEEARYLIRTCVGNLRTGAVEKSVLLALARACVLIHDGNSKPDALKHAEDVLKECYAQCPDWDRLIPWLQECGWDLERIFEKCGITVGVPLRPMLGQITRRMTDVFAKLTDRDFVCECKYDGQRAQIHMDEQGHVKLYSRHLEDMTDKYPDVVHMLPDIRKADVGSFIIDGEIVAINEKGTILPFQTLSNRERKNVTIAGIKVQVCVMAFDLMYLNGESLLRMSFRERRGRLRDHFVPKQGVFDFAEGIEAHGVPEDQEKVYAFFDKSVREGNEGMMVKVLDPPPSGVQQPLSTYEPDKRVESWLKVKKDYLEGVGDSLDLVPIGAWYGNGRKAGWYSPVLLACFNPENDTFESVCKCMSGFSDEFYRNMKQFYSGDRILEHARHDYVTDLVPDVWFDATEVWEIKGADITISPVHKGALGRIDPDRGLSLRFPRYLRTRTDKTIYEATTSEQLSDFFLAQNGNGT
ncbi:dna ligase [Lichtheimia corymbifera JMRC:FSU:9682]|uniref:DNA ligase n=1 Tax=Lichtheimia corymbifera JMRC:FSU:9682 TaxID=1263082 RepID=A0A068RMD3_9FUNG|nr:dna ligase [Lichtheimia corymbifera JMRC:FSU:9682]